MTQAMELRFGQLYIRITPKSLLKLREGKRPKNIRSWLSYTKLGFRTQGQFYECLRNDACFEEVLRRICLAVSLGCHNISLSSNRSVYICRAWKLFCVEKGYL